MTWVLGFHHINEDRAGTVSSWCAVIPRSPFGFSIGLFSAAAIIKLRVRIVVVESEERNGPLFSFTMSLAED